MISVVVPVRNDPERLRKCLGSLRLSNFKDFGTIVVDDASTDATAEVAREMGATLIRLDKRGGPGVARNRGASAARGDVLVFVDADVCVHADTLGAFDQAFKETPAPDAVFGAYDLAPAEPNLISQYKNLAHHFVHARGAGEATTFWAGCGAVRREVFLSLGGFSPKYTRPSIEDIELGVRLRRAGGRVLLRPEIQATHLKHWTLPGLVRSDLWDRATPWTELILREGQLPDTLNLTVPQRVSAILAWAAFGLVALATLYRPAALLLPILLFLFVWATDNATDSSGHSRPSRLCMAALATLLLASIAAVSLTLGPWALALAVPLAAIVVLNLDYYMFFARLRGPLFAFMALPLHLAYFACSGLGLAIGTLRHARRDKTMPPGPGSSPAESFKHADASSYDEVASNFDQLTERYSAPFAARIVEWADIKGGDHVLDIGTGTGLCALAAAQSVGESGRVLGIDLSENMLALARSKVSGEKPRVAFRPMDAESLDLPDRSFDAVVSLFALLHFPAPERALAQMLRVLKPGGRLVLAAGSGPPLFSRFTLVRAGSGLIALMRGSRDLRAPQALDSLLDEALPAQGAEETALAGHTHARPVRIDGLVRAAGFSVLRTHWESLSTGVESPEEFWDLQRTFSSRARKRLRAASASEVGAVRARLIDRARRVQDKGGHLVYTRAALFVVAKRPTEA